MEYIKEYNSRVTIECANKYSGHGELAQGYDFDKMYKQAIRDKKRTIQEELNNDVVDYTTYIGVNSNDKFAIVYMTREYFDYIKTLPSDKYTDQFVNAAKDFMESGGEPKVYSYSDQTEMRLFED